MLGLLPPQKAPNAAREMCLLSAVELPWALRWCWEHCASLRSKCVILSWKPCIITSALALSCSTHSRGAKVRLALVPKKAGAVLCPQPALHLQTATIISVEGVCQIWDVDESYLVLFFIIGLLCSFKVSWSWSSTCSLALPKSMMLPCWACNVITTQRGPWVWCCHVGPVML